MNIYFVNKLLFNYVLDKNKYNIDLYSTVK